VFLWITILLYKEYRKDNRKRVVEKEALITPQILVLKNEASNSVGITGILNNTPIAGVLTVVVFHSHYRTCGQENTKSAVNAA